ncbi:purine-nucleoside phosphorylase [Planctomycetota bacterium]
MPSLQEKVSDATHSVRERWPSVPQVVIVLGSGLGGFSDEIDVEQVIPYADIPHFKSATVIGHDGKLICGTIGGTNVCAMQGRFHRYEGYSLSDVAFPIRVFADLGVSVLVVSNACGGLNPLFVAGDVMVIEDQVNFLFQNPLTGISGTLVGEDREMGRPSSLCGTARPVYDSRLIELAGEIARRRGIPLQQGVYCSVPGPNYETRAELKMLRTMGVDVVGMSTIPEVIVANLLGLRVLGFSAVTNKCSPDVRVETSGEAVVVAAESTEPKMRDIVLGVMNEL